jgi:oligopeptide transport system ATP-binding protein
LNIGSLVFTLFDRNFIMAEDVIKEAPAQAALGAESGSKDRPITAPGSTLVTTDRITKYFRVRSGFFSSESDALRAVDGISLRIRKGETLSLVGESGCGKSTLGRLILRLVDPTYGRIIYAGQDITRLPQRLLRPLRRKFQLIFQDPYSSLNPRMTVKEALAEPLRIHRLTARGSEETDRIAALLARVGLRPDMMDRFPHEFSGGQRQRIGIARALAVEPEFIVCDEPISALDVSIQAQIVNLLVELQEELGVSYLFISHDLRVVQHIGHRTAVMYLGQLVEIGPSERIATESRHPYTRALVSAAPTLDPGKKKLRILLEGDVPSPMNPPTGCGFHPRCPNFKKGTCDGETPELKEVQPNSDHFVACYVPFDKEAGWAPARSESRNAASAGPEVP